MAIFQFAIFGQRLGMDNVVYWWMMQVSCIFLEKVGSKRGRRELAN
jgi:hypothetical protein